RLTRPMAQAARALQAAPQGALPQLPAAAGGFAELDSLRQACNALLQRLYREGQDLGRANAQLGRRVELLGADLAKAGEQAGANERRTLAMLAAAQEAYIGLDAAGTVTDWNGRAEQIFGWPRAQVLGKPVEQLLQAGGALLAGLADGSVGQPLVLAGWRRDG
ncbi:PAS domain-containing protein, partial [Pseudoduganella eburnea]